MSINYLELVGVESLLRKKLDELNMAFREGTLHKVGDVLAAIECEAREAGYVVNNIMFRK